MTSRSIVYGINHRYALVLIGLVLMLLLFDSAVAHGMSEEEKQSIFAGGNWSYLKLGITHMLSGYDHLAFVFGIIFFLTSFREIARYVTAFTVGHSVTLIYATFNAIQLNYFLIDAVIGLSVCYIAFANIDGFRKYLKVKPPNMLMMILGLGLIHGFGLSTRLQELPLSEDQLLLNIIAFNVGIELGQIAALTVMLLLIASWRKTQAFQTLSVISNYSLILLGAFLFMMQMHGYQHVANAEEFVNVSEKVIAVQPIGHVDDLEPWKDTVELKIPARGDLEYKLYVRQSDTFSFTWNTDGQSLYFDFHGEPANAPTGTFSSFSSGTEGMAEGTWTASFNGTHGWYWKNKTSDPVLVTLRTKGAYLLDAPEKAQIPVELSGKDSVKRHKSIF